jgi:hypothetical protein
LGNFADSLSRLEQAWPSLEKHLARIEGRFAQRLPSHKASARQADFVIEGYVDPTEPLRDKGPVEVRVTNCELPTAPLDSRGRRDRRIQRRG